MTNMNIKDVKKIIEDYDKGYIVLFELNTRLFECVLKMNPSDIIDNIPKKYINQFKQYVKRMIAEDYTSWISINMYYKNDTEEKEINKKLFEKWRLWNENE